MSDFTWILTSGGIVVAIVISGVMVVWRILEDRKSGFPAQDERAKKITGKAAMYAFSIGNYFMIVLMIANIFNREFLGSYLLDVGYALVMSTLVQSLMFLALRWYFNRKGDLQ